MLRKYLPRLGAGVLAFGLGAACGDPTSANAARSPLIALDVSVSDGAVVGQRGFEVAAALRDHRGVRRLRVFADSGTADQREFRWRYDNLFSSDTAAVVVYAPGAGRHRFTVVVGDTTGRNVSTTFERTFAFADAPYAATALPDLGAGANARALNARGDVAGWVLDARGTQRPAVWRGGTLEVLAAGPADSAGAVATRINSAGDVLLQLALPFGDGTAVRVRRADGALLTVGPLKYKAQSQATGDACCRVAADLSDDRRALGTRYGSDYYRTAILDVARGVLVDSVDGNLSVIAGGALAAGDFASGYANAGLYLRTQGFTASALPAGIPALWCDYAGRFSTTVPVDIDNNANLLVSYCGSPAYLPRAGTDTSAWVDRYVGPGTARLSRDNGIVASLDSAAGAIWLWRVGASAATRLRVAGEPWRFDGLGAVNGSGSIAAHGVNTATGRAAALLLTPAAR